MVVSEFGATILAYMQKNLDATKPDESDIETKEIANNLKVNVLKINATVKFLHRDAMTYPTKEDVVQNGKLVAVITRIHLTENGWLYNNPDAFKNKETKETKKPKKADKAEKAKPAPKEKTNPKKVEKPAESVKPAEVPVEAPAENPANESKEFDELKDQIKKITMELRNLRRRKDADSDEIVVKIKENERIRTDMWTRLEEMKKTMKKA